MFCGAGRNITVLTSLYYVPLTDERAEEVGGIRAAEHVDYGTLTLILQDDMGGLEVTKNVTVNSTLVTSKLSFPRS